MNRKVCAAAAALVGLLVAVGTAAARHGGGHLPPGAVNVELVGKLQLASRPGGIADVSAHKGFAYLAAWNPECPNGGTHVVDIRNPASPQKVAFVPAPAGYYVGEGVHLISMATPSFTGDVLLVNHEACTGLGAANPPSNSGGFSLIDVTNPASPRPLTGLVGDLTVPTGGTRTLPNSSHSIQGWVAGNRVFAALIDNIEATDVDIFEITDPRNPRQIADVGLANFAGAAQRPQARGNTTFFHDVQVEQIGGTWFMLLSYWDAGWILLNVNDPANPTVVRDHDFPAADPLTGLRPPEGNAHQAFWSSNRRYILGTSEDFASHRGLATALSGPFAGERFDANLAGTSLAQTFGRSSTPRTRTAGAARVPTVFAGQACAALPAAPLANAVAVIERGVCTFAEKIANARVAGYVATVIFNAAAAGQCDALFTPGGVPARELSTLSVPRSVGFKLLGIAGYNPANCPTGTNPALPAAGTRGADVSLQAIFDAWGYVTMLDATTLQEIGHYAVAEGLDEDMAFGLGALTVHEVKTDPRPGINLAYFSYYGAGARVATFDRSGIREVGKFIDEGGNDFWGTFLVSQGSARPLWLLSDRSFGLYILRYTGPEPAPEP